MQRRPDSSACDAATVDTDFEKRGGNRKPFTRSKKHNDRLAEDELANMKMVCASTTPPKYHEGRFGEAGNGMKTPSNPGANALYGSCEGTNQKIKQKPCNALSLRPP